MQISLGKQLSVSDWWVNSDRSWQCNGTKFNGEIGLETRSENWFLDGYMIGYHHESYLDCGGPFNHRPEVTQEDIRITRKFGGF